MVILISNMYHESRYEDHEESLERFIVRFNETSERLDGVIRMRSYENESFRDDGIIENTQTGQRILFDWEKRFNYYDSLEEFEYETLGQFERKIIKPEIDLSIQCSTEENGILIAWHEDLMEEERVRISSETETGKENNYKRFTRHFREFSYDNLDEFYEVLANAFENDCYNRESFN